jgi:3-oxoacyl-[acyl-carrier protein] reductase
MSAKEHAGRTVLVTGGSRGIGRGVCLALAREGARVAINYRSDESAADTTRALITEADGQAATFRADVSDPQAVADMVGEIASSLGPVDLLVTSAGIARMLPHTEMNFDRWRRTMTVNVDGTYLPVMAVKDGMLERGFGRIVCISSIAGLLPRGKMIAYSVSKAAVIAFTRSCADAFGPDIRVNCVAPGLIETDMGKSVGADLMQRMRDEAFLKRIGKPEEIAETVLFLLSERSSFITGQTFVADGGRVTLP